MAQSDDCILKVDDVERVLAEIENKYCSNMKSPIKNNFQETLSVLSQEFDSLGLPAINLKQSSSKVFKDVVNTTRCLVQIHRNSISQIKNIKIELGTKDSKFVNLQKKLDEYKEKIRKTDERIDLFKNKILKINDEYEELMKKESLMKDELERTKKYYWSKENELNHQIKKLTLENERIKGKIGLGIGSTESKENIALKLIKKYKVNEKVYKNTIEKLENNTKELLEENFTLKEELALANKH